MKITLFVPTLNEIIGLKDIMPKIDRNWVDQILIIDGGSDDGSAEWAREQGYDVYVQKQKGLRFAFIEGMEHVTGDAVITFSPDGNSLPESIPPLCQKLREGYDMVIASRYLDGAKSEDDDVFTSFGNWLFTRTVNFLHGSNYTDAMVMLRAYSKRLFYALDLHLENSYSLPEKLFHTVLGIEPLLSVRAAKAKLKMTEIGFDEPPRMGGKRKLQMWRWGAGYYFQFFYELFNWSPLAARQEFSQKPVNN